MAPFSFLFRFFFVSFLLFSVSHVGIRDDARLEHSEARGSRDIFNVMVSVC